MALDATVAGETANSYVTLAEADAFYSVRTGAVADAWNAESAPVLENALVVAAEMMQCVRYFYEKWSDAQTESSNTPEQALAFPRSHHIDNDDQPYIDPCVKQVQIHQAGAIIAAGAANGLGLDSDTLAELRALGIDSVRIGTTAISFGSAPTSRDTRRADLIDLGFCPAAAALLSRFVSKVGSIMHDAEDLIRLGELRRVDVFRRHNESVFEASLV